MKIRISLRIYVLVAMLLTGGSSIVLLSALSMHYFATGMDVAMRGSMYAQAQQYTVMDGIPIKSQQYMMASRWQDLPSTITSHFSTEDMPLNTLKKHMIGGTWFTPPSAGYFVMKVKNATQTVYVASTFNPDDRMLALSPEIPHFVVIIVTAIGAIFVFIIILIVVLKKITMPVERLKIWAKKLDKANLNDPLPDFQFSELNSLAIMTSESMRSVQESVEREQRFLAYASHELRTPIAVISSNVELIQKLLDRDAPKQKLIVGLNRIERAVSTMGTLIETLLWLNRGESHHVCIDKISISKLIQQLTSELEYLIRDKRVELVVDTDDTQMSLPNTVCRIVLQNVIRNAYIHTNEGVVSIIQTGPQVIIKNIDYLPESSTELGFGLGLELTQKLILQYQWQFVSEEGENGRTVTITFK